MTVGEVHGHFPTTVQLPNDPGTVEYEAGPVGDNICRKPLARRAGV